jgi:hypothetical protein
MTLEDDDADDEKKQLQQQPPQLRQQMLQQLREQTQLQRQQLLNPKLSDNNLLNETTHTYDLFSWFGTGWTGGNLFDETTHTPDHYSSHHTYCSNDHETSSHYDFGCDHVGHHDD